MACFSRAITSACKYILNVALLFFHVPNMAVVANISSNYFWQILSSNYPPSRICPIIGLKLEISQLIKNQRMSPVPVVIIRDFHLSLLVNSIMLGKIEERRLNGTFFLVNRLNSL